ncbi:MAG: hypothetical protein SGPRY_005070 [Prymnesium sp.]
MSPSTATGFTQGVIRQRCTSSDCSLRYMVPYFGSMSSIVELGEEIICGEEGARALTHWRRDRSAPRDAVLASARLVQHGIS